MTAHLQMRFDNMKPLKEAEAKFKAGLKFRISKVALDPSAKQEYLHTPLKLKIDLAKRKAVPLMQERDGATVQPCPSMCIKDCILLQQSQRFDVTALVDSLSDVRSVSETREVVKVTLIDDSGDNGKPAQLTFAFFMNSPRSKEDAAMMDIFKNLKKRGSSQSFHSLLCRARKRIKAFHSKQILKRISFLWKVSVTGQSI